MILSLLKQDFTQQFHKLTELLNGARNVLIVTHEYPDADGIGSALAVRRLCELKGIPVSIYISGTIPPNLRFLPGSGSIRDVLDRSVFDLAFCLDYGDFVRLRLPENLSIKTLVTIDHHPLASQRGDVVLLAPQLSSTAELIYNWFKFAGFELDKTISTCLLMGIAGDTGGFRHVSTSSETLVAAGELVTKGVPISKIMRKVASFPGDESCYAVIGKVLSRIALDRKSLLAYSWIGLGEMEKLELDAFSIRELPTVVAAVSPINFGLLLVQEQGNLVKGSFRAEPNSNRDVDALARLLGGGGHKYAAGFRYQGTLKEALKRVLELL